MATSLDGQQILDQWGTDRPYTSWITWSGGTDHYGMDIQLALHLSNASMDANNFYIRALIEVAVDGLYRVDGSLSTANHTGNGVQIRPYYYVNEDAKSYDATSEGWFSTIIYCGNHYYLWNDDNIGRLITIPRRNTPITMNFGVEMRGIYTVEQNTFNVVTAGFPTAAEAISGHWASDSYWNAAGYHYPPFRADNTNSEPAYLNPADSIWYKDYHTATDGTLNSFTVPGKSIPVWVYDSSSKPRQASAVYIYDANGVPRLAKGVYVNDSNSKPRTSFAN